MAQVTARVSDQLEARLNHWAAEDGMQRADLIRQILAEATEARREGRAAFERSDAPGPADLARLAAKLDAQTTELERVLRQNVKRDAELLKSAREDTLGVSDARARIVADVTAELRAAFDTLHRGWMQTRDELSALMQAPPQRPGIDSKLDRILEAARAPRTTRTYNIGLGDWSSGMLVSAGLIVLTLGMFAFLALAALLPDRWLELRTANRMLGGGDRAICRLVDYQYGTGLSRCRITAQGRTVTVTASAEKVARR